MKGMSSIAILKGLKTQLILFPCCKRSLYIHLDIFSTEGKVHQEKLDRAVFFAHVVNPCGAVGFVIIYGIVGFTNM